MASDGKITIDTSLNNSGFEKDSKQLLKTLERISDQIDWLGEVIQQSFMQYTQAGAEAVQVTDRIDRSVQSAGASFARMGSQGKQGASSLTRELNSLDRKVYGLDGLADKIGEGGEPAMKKFEERHQEAVARLLELRAKTEALGKQKIETKDYKEISADLEKAEMKLDSLYMKQDKMRSLGISDNSAGAKSLAYDIEETTARVDDLKASLEILRNLGEEFTLGSDSEQYQQTVQTLDSISERLADVKEKAEAAGAGYQESEKKWAEAADYAAEREQAVVEEERAERAAAQAEKAAARAGSRGKSVQKSAGFFSKMGSAAKKAAGHTAKLASSLGRVTKSTVTRGLQAVGTAFSKLRSASRGADGGLKRSLQSMVRYGFGMESVLALINRLRSVLTEGFKTLANFDGRFNTTVSRLISSLRQLRNQIAAAFSPIIDAVGPVLTRLIEMMTEVAQKASQMTAALTGRQSYMKATKVQYDYAESQKSSKNETDKATEAAKKNQKQLMGFDDINILKEDKDDSSEMDELDPTQGGFESVPIEDQIGDFAKRLVEAWRKADFTSVGSIFGQKLNDALNNIRWSRVKATLRRTAASVASFLNGFLETPGLFSNIGRTMAEGLNSAFEFLNEFARSFHWGSLGKAVSAGMLGFVRTIDWPLIYGTFRLYGAGFGTVVNETFCNPVLWAELSTALGRSMNAAVYGALAFFQTVDWARFGSAIAAGWNTGISSVDWAALGTLTFTSINALLSTWKSLVSEFDWAGFGQSVGGCLSTAIRGINWSDGGYDIGATITGLFETMRGFTQTVDWHGLAFGIVTTIATALGTFDWGQLSGFISDCCSGLFDSVGGALDAIDWEALPDDICQQIGEFLAGFDWTRFCQSLGRMLGSAFKALIQIGSSLWNKMLEFGGSIIEGGWQGIKDKMNTVGDWIKKNILDPFVNGFKDAFGIHSPARAMVPLGLNVADGLLSGISEGWNNVINFLSSAPEQIENIFSGQAWNTWTAIGGDIVNGLWNGIQSSWDGLCQNIGGFCNDMVEEVQDFLGIHSPSKIFRDKVGRFLTLGLADGLQAESAAPVRSVQALGKRIEEEAQKINPMFSLSLTDVSSKIDEILNAFGDRLISGFEVLYSELSSIAQDAPVPAVATGRVLPYSTRSALSRPSDTDRLAQYLEGLTSGQNQITKEDIREAFDEALEAHPTEVRIGDETVARAAQRGSSKLNRRFKTKK